MRKIFLYIFILIVLIFILPIIFTKKFETVETAKVSQDVNNSVIQDDIQYEDYNYGKYNKIKLLHKSTGEVEEVNLDEYLYHVVSAEMPVDYELEALKAQAIVARTYTVYKIKNGSKHENADICDDSACCQAWISKEKRFEKWEDNKEEKWNKIVQAVEETKGKIITYDGEPIDAFFHSNSGGMTEIPVNVWGGSNYPYLQAVETSGEDEYSQYFSEAEIKKDELEKIMKKKYPNFQINWNEEKPIEIIEYTEGTRVKTLKIGNTNISGVEARNLFSLKSAKFNIEILDSSVKFSVIGYGHGVGLSQTGSNTLAKQGMNCEDIIKHFYSGVEISDALF